MRSLTYLHESRVCSPENFPLVVQKDFCNKIGPWLPIQNVRFSAASERKAEVLALL
jgi:hypothetical protein